MMIIIQKMQPNAENLKKIAKNKLSTEKFDLSLTVSTKIRPDEFTKLSAQRLRPRVGVAAPSATGRVSQ